MSPTQIVFTAAYQGQQGVAYALNTLDYRFRPAIVGGENQWITVKGYYRRIWAETGREEGVYDPSAPTRADQLALLEAARTR